MLCVTTTCSVPLRIFTTFCMLFRQSYVQQYDIVNSLRIYIICYYKYIFKSFLQFGVFIVRPAKRKCENKMSAKTLEKYLRELRSAYDYSQEFVASRLNISRQTYSHYETGRITPPLHSLYHLSGLYGIPVGNFLELTIDSAAAAKCLSEGAANTGPDNDDLNDFLNHISIPENHKKFKFLKRREKLILYYYQLLDDRDQEDIPSFMKVKCRNRKAKIPPGASSAGISVS